MCLAWCLYLRDLTEMILGVYIVNLLTDLRILDLVNPGLDFAQSSHQWLDLKGF
jgi:hypothetical protein